MHRVKGVVAKAVGEPVSLETILVPDPVRGEALVAVQACGVCHTDLHYREGGINDEFPFLLGHEAAGIVEAVGEGVTNVEVGDFVVLNWRAVCGECRACKRGEAHLCFNTHNATQVMTLEDGTPLSPALGIGAFAEKTLVAAGQCTKVDPAASAAAAGLLGCGVMAGFGAAVNTGGITRGQSIAVLGCGGVGDGAIAGAALVGASPIIAVDMDDRKLAWAKEMGATHTINATEVDDVVEAIQELTGGFGADVVIEAVGRPETYKQAFYARDLAGTVVLVGVPTPDMTLELPLIDFFSRGGALKASWYGDCLPERDFPMLIDLHLQGRFPLEKFVTEEIGIGDVEAAFSKMRHGDVLRSVVLMGDGMSALRVDHAVTSGTFSLDGETFDVDNNVWVLGDESSCLVIDAPHSVADIMAVVGDRRVEAIVCTHGHDDHVRMAPPLAEVTGAPVLLHPDDRVVWDLTHPDRTPDGDLVDGQRLTVGGEDVEVIHTPGHAPGAVCLYVPSLGVVFSGDTLFNGGPGATGRSFSDFPTILASIHDRLFALPDATRVLTGHGDATTIGAERPAYDDWVARGR